MAHSMKKLLVIVALGTVLAASLTVWRGDVALFTDARRREDRAFAEFALADKRILYQVEVQKE